MVKSTAPSLLGPWLAEKAGDGIFRLHPQDGQGGAGHAQVGDKARAPGQNLGVGGGHMGVGSPHGLDPAVQIPPHGPLLTGGLGVEVHKHQVGLHLRQNPVGGVEGGVQVGIQLKPAHEVHHPQPQPLGPLIDPKAPAGEVGGKVGRPQDVGAVLQIVLDLQLVPGVVAQGDHIRPGVKNLLRVLGQQAQTGGVLPVDHGEVDVIFLLQGPQAAAQAVQAPLGHHIPHGKYIQQHGKVPPLGSKSRLIFYYMPFAPKSKEGKKPQNFCPCNRDAKKELPRPVGSRAGKGIYLAYSTILTSRSRWTLICPGYSSSFSIRWAISRASRTISSSLTTSGLTMMRTSRPAWMA